MLKDSDLDGLTDPDDPYPTKFDCDGDGLSDKIELDIGTQVNLSDTDSDGLTDYQEFYGWGMYGWKTNPLSADTDHDFIGDAFFQNGRGHHRGVEAEGVRLSAGTVIHARRNGTGLVIGEAL